MPNIPVLLPTSAPPTPSISIKATSESRFGILCSNLQRVLPIIDGLPHNAGTVGPDGSIQLLPELQSQRAQHNGNAAPSQRLYLGLSQDALLKVLMSAMVGQPRLLRPEGGNTDSTVNGSYRQETLTITVENRNEIATRLSQYATPLFTVEAIETDPRFPNASAIVYWDCSSREFRMVQLGTDLSYTTIMPLTTWLDERQEYVTEFAFTALIPQIRVTRLPVLSPFLHQLQRSARQARTELQIYKDSLNTSAVK